MTQNMLMRKKMSINVLKESKTERNTWKGPPRYLLYSLMLYRIANVHVKVGLLVHDVLGFEVSPVDLDAAVACRS